MYHPVTGATANVADGDSEWYEANGWQDVTPFEFQDNSWASVNPDANAAQEQAEKDAQGIPDEQPAEQPAQPKASKTTAADPNAAGVKADAGPS
jgi:hypothetical protein